MSEKREGYHFIGIGGIGMSALARILIDEKRSVTGSDLAKSQIVEELMSLGAKVTLGHSQEAVKPGHDIVFNSRIQEDNPEVIEARRLGARILHRSELLWELAKPHFTLAVAGTHGKTTTSSLLTFVLHFAGLDPSFAVGGIIPGLANGKRGKSDFFVLEADESDGSFLRYHPNAAILTNVECEHMEHFHTLDRLKASFKQFAEQVRSKKQLFYCKDDLHLASLGIEGVSYGFDKASDAVLDNFCQNGFSISYDLHYRGVTYRDIELPLTGQHNALNSSAVFALALSLGVSEEKVRAAFKVFPGARRRAEKRAECHGILLLDDYGHHPTEVRKSCMALREAVGERRLIVCFQPHRYTRLSQFMDEFSSCFESADELIVTDLYSAGEKPIENVSSERLVELIGKRSTLPCRFVKYSDLVAHLAERLRPHDVLVTFGAGSITDIHPPLKAALEKKGANKLRVGLIFGGRSCEHEISLRSARFARDSLKAELYELSYFGIDKGGGWVAGEQALKFLEEGHEIPAGVGKSFLSREVAEPLEACEIYYPVLHGPFGEDGTIQGLFEMLSKPYVGPDLKSAAISMDKVMTKRLLLQEGVPCASYLTFTHLEWVLKEEELVGELGSKLVFPLIVKPRYLGSSIGVSKATTVEELKAAIADVFNYDRAVLVEEYKEACRELEFPVLGSEEGGVKVATPGEKLAGGKIVDYEMKYSKTPVKTDVAPKLEPETLKRAQDYVKKAFNAIGGSVLARIDCLLDPSGAFWFMEANTIPGMTSLSLFPKIWAGQGISNSELMDRLVVASLARARRQNRYLNTL